MSKDIIKNPQDKGVQSEVGATGITDPIGITDPMAAPLREVLNKPNGGTQWGPIPGLGGKGAALRRKFDRPVIAEAPQIRVS